MKMFLRCCLCLSIFLLFNSNIKVKAELFAYGEQPNIPNTILPNEWSSVSECPVRYVDFAYTSSVAPVFGRPAYEREFAHMAAIGWTQKDSGNIEWNCGGSLITENFILTAGHCSSFRGAAPDVVRLGDLDLQNDEDNENAQQFTVTEVITHPDYSGKFRYHDLALLKLNASVTLHDTVCPACIWNNQTIKFKTIEACGYGQIGLYEDKTPRLLKVSLSPVPTDECKRFYPPDRKLKDGLTDQQMCAVDPEGKQDTCLGDSGGPLQIKLLGKGRQNPFLLGVTSFGKGCGSDTPGVYVRLSEYIDWLESATGSNFNPFECVQRYAEHREYEPDIVTKRADGFENIDSTKKHIETYSKFFDHLVEIGWPVGKGNVAWLCTGTIITELFVLTSASCLSSHGNNPTKVRTSKSKKEQNFNAKKLFVHPGYIRNVLDNDIALIELDKEAVFRDDLRPSCLWSEEKIPGIELDVLGKGPLSAHNIFIEKSFSYTIDFLYSRSSRIPISNCSDFYRADKLQVSQNQLCYGNDWYILPNSCQIISGAPLNRLYHATGYGYQPFQFGIQIYGNDCGFGYPTVSTRVSKYIDWIDTIIFGGPKLPPTVSEEQGACNLPSGGKGICKNSSKCLEVVDMIRRGYAKFQDYLCDFSDHQDPSICCPSTSTYNLKDCVTKLRKFRKPASKKWPPEFNDDLSFSHIAILLSDTKELGYGVLITDQHVLASYSIEGFDKANAVILGSKSDPIERRTFTVSDVKNIENSFLLFKLSDKITFSQSIVPACLWLDKTNVPFDGLNTFKKSSRNPDELKLVRLRPYQNSVCRLFFKNDTEVLQEISDQTSCAKPRYSDLNLCDLWDGLPVQAVRNETGVVVPYLVGFESFIANCGTSSTLLFDRVAYLFDSIIRHL